MAPVELYRVKTQEEEEIFAQFEKPMAVVNEDLQAIREWMSTQPHLPEIMDPNSIKNFLVNNKCSVEVTKKKIDSYYSVRSRFPEVYKDINPKLPHMKRIIDVLISVPLPQLTPQLSRVFLHKIPEKHHWKDISHQHFNGYTVNFTEIRLRESLQLSDIHIYDASNMTADIIKKISPTMLQKFMLIHNEFLSFRVSAVYIINSTPGITAVFNILKAVLKPKLLERIHFCKNQTDLLDFFPKEMLPSDYGGEGKSLEELQEIMKKKFLEYQPRFDEIDDMIVDENLRPLEVKNDEFMGVQGSFRKLEFD